MRLLRFRIVALIAAYAVALHTLLAFALVGPVGGAPHVAELCSGAATDNTPTAPHDVACAMACAMLGGTAALATPSPAITHIVLAIELRLDPAIGSIPVRLATDDPPRARAPPLA